MREQTNTPAVTEIWEKYLRGVRQHQSMDLYAVTERCHRFYEGDQWYGAQTGGELLPCENFIEPVVKYQVSGVAQNDTHILFGAEEGDEAGQLLCERLSRYAAAQWEQLRLDSRKWELVRNAAIEGDYYAYLFAEKQTEQGPQLKLRFLHRTQVYLADEQEPELANQAYILVAFRQGVEEARRLARLNGADPEALREITADEADDTLLYEQREEVPDTAGKCTVLLQLRLTPQGLYFTRSTRSVILQPETLLPGMACYPIAGMRWQQKHGSARGVGCVEPLIANQIAVNKTLARRAVAVKRLGFPTMAVDINRVANPEALGRAGAVLELRSLTETPVNSLVGYLQPPAMNGDASALQTELLNLSRELKGAGDAVTGQVEVEKTSGEAIKAARDAAAQSLTEQSAAYRQWAEELARIMAQLYLCACPQGLTLPHPAGGEIYYPPQLLREFDLRVRVDVTGTDPYSLLSTELALQNALQSGHITFEEYVRAIPAGCGVPKAAFMRILAQRQTAPEAPAPQAQTE